MRARGLTSYRISDRVIAVRLLLVFILLTAGSGASETRTWRVARDGAGDFTTIQPAVDAAASGDTIRIGAGRYTETHLTTAFGAPERLACVVVTVDSLTFVGDDLDSVSIGPDAYSYWNYGPVGIGAIPSVGFMSVVGVTLVNHYEHIRKEYGSFLVGDCRFIGGGDGVVAMDIDAGEIVGCGAEGCRAGVTVYDGANLVVHGSRFVDCGHFGSGAVGAMRSVDVSLEDCEFEMGGAGIYFYASTGRISACRLERTTNSAIYILGLGGDVTIEHSATRDCVNGLYVGERATVHGTRDSFHGTEASVGMARSDVTLRDCHILNGGGWSVQLFDDWNYEVGTYDLRSNWWGVADSTQIANWIYDEHDNQTVGAEVVFYPFLTQPVGVQEKSLGGLKALFR